VTAVTTDIVAAAIARNQAGLASAAQDTLLVAGRNLRKLTRVPQLIVFSTIQPVMLLLLFSYVFGGIARVPGISYREYIVPAVLVQTLTFAAAGTGVGLATDLQTGMIDRFRSLPIARSAVLVGRTVADAVRIGLQTVLLLIVAYAIGFRFLGGAASALGMFVLVVLFGAALSTFMAWVGLSLRDPETVQVAGFVPIFPLIFASSAFAPVRTLPGWMQGFARLNPVTAAVDTMRALAVGSGPAHGVYSRHLGSSLWHMVLAMGLIAAVFTSLSVRRYRTVS
jgi:ABC-2 type transport system permease protein/oleandomycin transport system permease protein